RHAGGVLDRHPAAMPQPSSLVLAARLEGEGARVVAFDPVAKERAAELLPSVEMAPSALEALEGVDAAVLVTEWPEFAELDWAERARRMMSYYDTSERA